MVADIVKSIIDFRLNFDGKALLKSAKMKLRIRISKFSSFIHYVVGLFVLKTKI
jgi:hypothetical protein